MPIFILKPKNYESREESYIVYSDNEEDARRSVNTFDHKLRPLAAGKPMTEDYFLLNNYKDKNKIKCILFEDTQFELAIEEDAAFLSASPNIKQSKKKQKKMTIVLFKNIPKKYYDVLAQLTL
jgi:hypothetical protein